MQDIETLVPTDNLEMLVNVSFDEVRLKTPFEGYENTASKFYESNGFKRSHQEKYIHVYK